MIFFCKIFPIFFLSFFLSIFFCKIIIFFNKKNNGIITENIRILGISGERKKKRIPTMGGISFVFSTIISIIILSFSSLKNFYIIMLIITMLWMSFIGFIDDYIKIRYNKNGINAYGKILSQTILGIFISCMIYFNNDCYILNYSPVKNKNLEKEKLKFETTIPNFLSKILRKKNKTWNYSFIFLKLCYKKNIKKYTWIIFTIITIGIIIFLSNGVNITDGIDGLAAGTSIVILFILSLISIIYGSKNYHYYLHFYNFSPPIYIPNIKETIIFSLSYLGSLIGFFLYNNYPAKIFMGDTGSLSTGSIIAVLSIINRIEIIIPVLCGIFFIENFSVIIQVIFIKYFKKKFFLMAPIHHHFQKKGYHESIIFKKFIVIQTFLSILTLFFLLF